jgi:hypothetical protein
MQPKWEYLVSTVDFNDAQMTEWLNIHGSEGWEVVSTRGHAALTGPAVTVVFKRPLVEVANQQI